MSSAAGADETGNSQGFSNKGEEDASPRLATPRSDSAPTESSNTATPASAGTGNERSKSYTSPRQEWSPSSGDRRGQIRRVGSSGDMYRGKRISSQIQTGTPSPHRRQSHDDAFKAASLVKLKTSIRVRRKSLKPAGPDQPHTIVAKKNVNFAPVGGTKFHEALEITLKREQEGHNKYKMVKRIKKYRGMRSDSKAERRAQIQKRRIAKRQRKGQKQKVKDIIHKQHEQYALTYGMMLGVQMSVGRQFEFSANNSYLNLRLDAPTEAGAAADSVRAEPESKESLSEDTTKTAEEGDIVASESLELQLEQSPKTSSLRQLSSQLGKNQDSIDRARAQSKEGASVAVDSSTGEVVSVPSLQDIREAADNTKKANNQRGSKSKSRRQSSKGQTGIRGDMDGHAHILRMSDFMAVDKYVFPLSINSMKSNFKFKDYAPLAFRKLRNFWGVEKYEYLLSVCPPDQGFINFISNSKSGQYFFYSHDMKYMIKTLSDEECKFLRRILPHYVRHMTSQPNSLINRYYGLHRVKMPHIRRKLHFVVMNNIFFTPKPIHTKYDLKGATYRGRYVKTSKIASKHSSNSVRKDLNWMGYTDDNAPGISSKTQPVPEHKQYLRIGDPKRKLLLIEQIARDAVFLAEMKIMDYSLLVGVHGREAIKVPGYSLGMMFDEDEDYEEESDEEDDENSGDSSEEESLHLGGANTDENKKDALVSSPGMAASTAPDIDSVELDNNEQDYIRSMTESGEWEGEIEDEATGNVVNDDNPAKVPLSVFQQDDGGFEGRRPDGELNNEIYYVGIIDILQQYNVRKWGENKLKSYFTDQGTKKISAIPPKQYARRFINFVAASIK